jgi:transglutaminase-like putative cysteine protease
MKQILLIIMILLISLSSAVADPISESDLPVRYTSRNIAYDVNTDGSYAETQTWSAVILKESALEDCKEASVTFSTSVAKGEILEAYTIKKSGKRIDAPKSSYQVSAHDGYNSASPLYSDETTISVVFPDLAVGDTTVFSYRVVNREGMFPNQFSITHVFSRYTAYDDVDIKITAPVTMKLNHESYFLTALKPVEKDRKQILEWKYQNKVPEKWTPADAGIYAVGDEPSLYVSTFENYRQIAETYGARAIPKAAVTERVKALASKIVADRSAPASQAQAVYEWVAKNISYAGNCIGIGSVVPRDLDVVLDNKMGDCKDHATLLQALLAAIHIDSEPALVNAGSLYELPKVPVVSVINHVINYLPGMKLFLDSTSSEMPFGMLHVSLSEKPVLLVKHFQEGMKTPSMAQHGHEQVMRSKIRINPDGTATGTVRVRLKGNPAIIARAFMRNLRGDQEDYVVSKIIEVQGFHGTGKLQKDDPTELLDVYDYSITFQLKDLLNVASTTGMPIRPVTSSFLPVDIFLRDAYEPLPKKPLPCSGGHSVEEYIYEFPASEKIVGIPKDYEFSSPAVYYKASYQKTGNTLKVIRELRDKTTSSLCSAAFTESYRKSARTIIRDTKSQLLISN